MTKTFYEVTYFYCGGHLANGVTFTDKKRAFDFAIEIAKDEDNTEITIKEIVIKGFFKKTCEVKALASFNEE
jgi:hypothetical protein